MKHEQHNETTTAAAGTSFLQRLSRPVLLTEGKPWKVILLYAVPIMLSYLLQQVYALTDAIICGQVLQAEQVAGVNDTFPLMFVFLQFAFGCTSGFSVITGRYAGNKDVKGVRKSFATQIYLTLAISVVLTVISILLLPWMLGLLHVTPENPVVYKAAYEYCVIIFGGILAQMGYNFICGILRAYGDSVTPLAFLIFSTFLNVALDILFLVVFRMGPAGAAIATVLAQALSVIACFGYVFLRYKELRPQREDLKIDVADAIAHLKQGLPLGLQFSVLAIGIIVMQAAVVRFDLAPDGIMTPGTPAQNGFAAASKLINFLFAFFNGLAAGLLGYNAQNFGKGSYDRIRKGTWQTLGLMMILFVFCLVVGGLLLINGAYQHIFLSEEKISPASLRFGNICLIIDVSMFFVLGFLIVSRCAVQGIGKSGYVFGAGIAELVARVGICAFLPAIVNGAPIDNSASLWAFAAVCFGDPGAWIAASLVLLIPLIKNITKMKY